jgi:CubicO group peptidase (beta-lactamase class C family)
MIRPREVPSVRPTGKEPAGKRGLGWDIRTGFSSNRGEGMSAAAFGHGGFTGTGIWIDPEKDLFVIFLSNRVHPDGKVNINPLIGKIGTIAVEVLTKK